MEDQEPIDDPQAYQALLKSIGSHANDPRYAKALVDILGVDGVNKLYDTINYAVAVNLSGDHNTQQDYVDPLKAFNDTLAAGLAKYDDGVTEFVNQLAEPVGGPARLGMIAQS